ncbi:MAG TPA: DUF4097 family beta strand repeat-containing protein [Bacteroidales bacterium]|nr:DUF4097 family beta strand repeat-containing protein [Bacteroidales bacterium]
MWNKTVIFLLLIFFAAIPVLSQTVVKEYVDSVPVSRNMTITINSKKSNLEITRWEKSMLWLKVKIAFTNNDVSMARRELQYSRFNLTRTSAEVNINNFFALPVGTDKIQSIISIDYKVYIPDKVILIINNDYGICRLSGVNGYININNKYGEIYLNRISGTTRIYSTLCDIHADYISGITQLEASNSNIFLKSMNGQMAITNKVGKIHFEAGTELDRLKINSSHCDIDLIINDPKRFNYNITVKNATIEFSQKFNDIPFTSITKQNLLYQSPKIAHDIYVSSSYNSIKLH